MRVHYRTSKAVDYVLTDLLRGRVSVYFANGLHYQYKNVSRRAILNLECNPNMSLGFWVNDNCIFPKRVSYRQVGNYGGLDATYAAA